MSVIMSRPAHDPKYAGAEKETAAGIDVDCRRHIGGLWDNHGGRRLMAVPLSLPR